jgi:rubredoxin
VVALEQLRRCPDCGGPAEPEEDAETRYWSCTLCEYEFGWERLATADTCSIGVPAALQATGPATVFIERIGRRPE